MIRLVAQHSRDTSSMAILDPILVLGLCVTSVPVPSPFLPSRVPKSELNDNIAFSSSVTGFWNRRIDKKLTFPLFPRLAIFGACLHLVPDNSSDLPEALLESFDDGSHARDVDIHTFFFACVFEWGNWGIRIKAR